MKLHLKYIQILLILSKSEITHRIFAGCCIYYASCLPQDFVSHFDKYRSLDRRILDLAVENTNLKAIEIIDAFERLPNLYLASISAPDGMEEFLEAVDGQAVI